MPTLNSDSNVRTPSAWGRSLRWVVGRILPPIAAAVLLLILWEVVVEIWKMPDYLLPAPRAVAREMWNARGLLFQAWWTTACVAVIGLVISLGIGTLTGILFAQSALVRYAFYPYAVFLQTVPIVAIAPLLVMWFGFGRQGVVAVACVLSLFPIVANVTAGMMSVPRPLLELFSLYQANRWQRLIKLEFPFAVPHLMTGLKTSSGLSVIGAIVGEFFVGYGSDGFGLGYLIRSAAESYRTASLFAAVVLSTFLGVVVFAVVSGVAERVQRRWGFEVVDAR